MDSQSKHALQQYVAEFNGYLLSSGLAAESSLPTIPCGRCLPHDAARQQPNTQMPRNVPARRNRPLGRRGRCTGEASPLVLSSGGRTPTYGRILAPLATLPTVFLSSRSARPAILRSCSAERFPATRLASSCPVLNISSIWSDKREPRDKAKMHPE